MTSSVNLPEGGKAAQWSEQYSGPQETAAQLPAFPGISSVTLSHVYSDSERHLIIFP